MELRIGEEVTRRCSAEIFKPPGENFLNGIKLRIMIDDSVSYSFIQLLH